MFYLGLVILIASFIAIPFLSHYIGVYREKASSTDAYEKREAKKALDGLTWGRRAAVYAGLGMFFLGLTLGSVSCIGVGHVGVQTLFGKIQDRVLREGVNIRNPMAVVHDMTIQTQSYTMSIVPDEGEKDKPDTIKVLSKDNLEVEMDLTVLYSLVPGDAQLVFRNVGDTQTYIEKIVRPGIRTAIRNSASKFEASILMSSGRAAAEADIQKSMEDIFKDYFGKKGIPVGIVCERVLLRNVQPPETLKKAIEDKLSKEQQKEAMEFVLDTEKKKAEQRIIEAEGIAKSQTIIHETLTKEYLQWKYIEALEKLVLAPNTTTLILPFDQKLTPMLNVSELKK